MAAVPVFLGEVEAEAASGAFAAEGAAEASAEGVDGTTGCSATADATLGAARGATVTVTWVRVLGLGLRPAAIGRRNSAATPAPRSVATIATGTTTAGTERWREGEIDREAESALEVDARLASPRAGGDVLANVGEEALASVERRSFAVCSVLGGAEEI